MESETPLKIPSINFTNLTPNTKNNDWNLTKSQVYQALVEFGCLEVRLDNFPLDLETSMYDSLRDIFDLPLEKKLKISSANPFNGYVEQIPTGSLFESMVIDDAPILDNAESFTKILWPNGNHKISKTIQEFSNKLSKLDQMVRIMVLESMGLEKYMDEHMSSSFYEFRIIKYKVPEATQTGLNTHTDRDFLTVLHQHQVSGLEVQTKSGNWIKVQPSPTSFIVVIGDSLHAWTNGRLYAPYHRVVMSGDKPRYSIGLFSQPKAGYVLKAPPEVVDEEHPLIYKPFKPSEFVKYVYNDIDQQAQPPLKTYFGV